MKYRVKLMMLLPLYLPLLLLLLLLQNKCILLVLVLVLVMSRCHRAGCGIPEKTNTVRRAFTIGTRKSCFRIYIYLYIQQPVF
jgi:hypothetical protein